VTPKTRARPELTRHYRRWTRADVKVLRDLWGTLTLATIADKLGRSPSEEHGEPMRIMNAAIRALAQATSKFWDEADER